MEQKHLNIFVVVLLVGIIGVSSVAVVQQMSYQSLDSEYQDLLTDYETLSSEWNQTSDDLNNLQSDFETMQTAYLTLIDDYASLSEIHLIVLSNNTDLQQSLDDLQELYDQLLEDFDLLNASFVELEQNYADLQADYAQLQSDYDELQANYNQLLLDYDDLVTQLQALQDSYNALVIAYATLEFQYNALVLDYNTLLVDYNMLIGDYLALQDDYDALELSYNALATWIRQQILPAQYMVFAEAVRRYYFEDFYVQNKWAEGNISGYWAEFARFCRDVILHDSYSYFGSGDKKIVLDYSHGQYSSYVELIDEWLEGNLTALGFTTVIWAYGGLNSSVLAGADALILGAILGDNGFTTAEVTAVGDWFNEGHKFLWVGGDSDYDGTNVGNNMTLILEEVGSHVYHEPTAIEDPISNCGSGYRAVANGTSDDAFVADIVEGVDAVLMHGPTLLYGSDSDTPGENVNSVALETVVIENVYPLLYYGGSATITDGDITHPYAHTDGQVGAFVAATMEIGAGKDGTGVIVVSGASPYGDYRPMYAAEYYNVTLTGYKLVNQAIYFGTLRATDSLEGLLFSDVSNALADCLRYGSRTEYLAYQNFYWAFWPWVHYWSGDGKTGDALTDIFNVVQWCVDEIDYEYDSDITRIREPYGWDYIKFPVETAFRTMGDCEDQAILTAAHLESCGFETAMLIVHDENNTQYGPFYHGALFVKLDNLTAYWERYPSAFVWNMAWWDSSWDQGGVLIDTTWNTPFGTQPAWLQYYLDTYSLWSELTPIWTIAFCDIDGFITYVPSGAGSAALEAYVP